MSRTAAQKKDLLPVVALCVLCIAKQLSHHFAKEWCLECFIIGDVTLVFDIPMLEFLQWV